MSHAIVNPEGLHDPVPFGYSHTATIPAGTELVFVSGQYGSDANGAVVSTDFTEQVEQAFRNVGVALAAHGLDLSQSSSSGRTWWTPTSRSSGRSARPCGAAAATPRRAQTVIGVAGLAMPDIHFEVEAVSHQALSGP